MRCKALMLVDLPNTLNMCVRPTENFLRAFEFDVFSSPRAKKIQKFLVVSHIDFIFFCDNFTNLIQCALCFCDVIEHFTYPHCICRWCKKFLYHFEVNRLFKNSQNAALNLNYTHVTFRSKRKNAFLLP